MAEDYRRDEEQEHERDDYLEETAAETAPFSGDLGRADDDARIDEDDRGEQAGHGTGYGILALVLSILAFFFLPVVMGAAGIIIGFIARSKGANAWGGWAIGIGIAAIVISLFAAPFL
ncbi:MAG TPA: DUF4190 domain-containing protein [Bacillales bacterium]|nr:DUF4190 domain-containing protein [Bacillales bacterium]